MNRRKFILVASSGMVLTGANPNPPAMQILTLASRAPSGHNTQPWTVNILTPTHWIVGISDSRRLPAVDPAARETYLSLGAFLENLIVAATHYGFQVAYSIRASSPSNPDVIDLRFLADQPSPQRLDRIRLRRTVRNGFQQQEIESADLNALMKDGDGFHFFPKGSPAARHLSEGTLAANRRQAFRDPAEEELARWIRWSAADQSKYQNGLTPAGMEIGGLPGWYVSHFYNHASVLSNSFRETTIKQVKERVDQGAGWLLVTSPVITNRAAEPATLIETGRRVERMWLGLRDRNLAIHPMTQMLEEAPWNSQIAASLGVAGTPQFLLRIGYLASYPMPASPRMPPSWIVTGSQFRDSDAKSPAS